MAAFWDLLFQEVDAESNTHAVLLFLTLCLQLTPVDLIIKPYRVTHNYHFIKQICIIKGISQVFTRYSQMAFYLFDKINKA